jgi:origin recognition complex subunit 4
VESVINDIAQEHRDNFHVVRLNGFIHTDDKLALKEIWRQLGREMEIEDDQTSKVNLSQIKKFHHLTTLQSNYADTLASLLALLSHPSEISDTQTGQTAKSVIFVLDEFDLFTTHPRQTLLYNLFDIAQARKAPIVVLGLTTRIDVVENLEKRVKSRFSHRYVHLSLPRSLLAYWEICKEGLMVDEETESIQFAESGRDEFLTFWRTMIDVCCCDQ